MRIVIRVIASKTAGLGHVYRALTLAEEFGKHDVTFAVDERATLAIPILENGHYVLGITAEDVVGDILSQEPDLVINDVLDTDADYVWGLKAGGCKVVNFEDLGPGADHADLVINALFQEPRREGGHYLWGIDHFFLRNEFVQAQQAPWSNKVDSVLVTFGGTDHLDLTGKVVDAVGGLCRERRITLYVVTGPGYEHEAKLMKTLWEWGSERVFYVRETGMMAQIMSRCQMAFVSNGRTVYELVHMHIPAIVVAQHERENTHDFADPKNGFINLGVYSEGITKYDLWRKFIHLLEDSKDRRLLWEVMQRFDLSGNKARVARRILEVME